MRIRVDLGLVLAVIGRGGMRLGQGKMSDPAREETHVVPLGNAANRLCTYTSEAASIPNPPRPRPRLTER